MKPIQFCLFDIFKELGKAFLDIKPSEFIFEYKESYQKLDTNKRSLTDFGSGEFMRLLQKDLRHYEGSGDGTPKIHVILTVSTDDTTVGSWRKNCENPLYLAIMNATKTSYKLVFLGYGPVRMPYTDEELLKMLDDRGYKTKAGRKIVMKNLRAIALQNFFTIAFGEITTFGKNHDREITRRFWT